MVQLGPRNDRNLVTMGPGPKTIFVIDEIHEEVGSWQSDFLHHLTSHYAPRGNNKVGEPDRLAKKLRRRLCQPVAPKPRNIRSARVWIDRQCCDHSNVPVRTPQRLSLL